MLNLILLPGGGHRSSQGNEGIFVQNTFSQLFSISAFALYVGMLSLALPSTATLSLAAFYKSISKWRNPTSPQETKTKWTDFFKIQFKSSLFSSSHMLSVKTFVSIFDILAFISICLRHQIFAVQDFWSQNFLRPHTTQQDISGLGHQDIAAFLFRVQTCAQDFKKIIECHSC